MRAGTLGRRSCETTGEIDTHTDWRLAMDPRHGLVVCVPYVGLSPTIDVMSPTDARLTKFPEQNADGVDMSIIRRNLQLTPTERVRRADRRKRDILWLRANARLVAPDKRS